MSYSDKTNVFGQDVDLNGHLRPSVLLAKLEEIDGLKAQIQALREEEARLRGKESTPVCPTCGAPSQEGDLYCRTCGGKL